MKTILFLVGLIAIAMGLIWVGQGMGYLTWTPAGMHPSFMIGDMHWTYYGAGLAVLGLLIVMYSRRRGDMRG
jgi:hypothetical protein